MALRNTREIASQFSLSFFGLTSFLCWRIANFWYILDATRLGRTNFPTRWTFSVTVWLLWVFARLIGLKTLCSSVVSVKTSAARRPEAFLTNCHAYSTLPLNFSHSALRSFHFGFWLDCSPIWWCIQAHTFSPNSQGRWSCAITILASNAVEIVSNGLLGPSFLSNLSSNYFSSSVSLKPESLGF